MVSLANQAAVQLQEYREDLSCMKLTKTNVTIAAAMTALTIALVVAALQPVQVMHDSSAKISKVKAKVEGLSVTRDRFESSPLAITDGEPSTMQDMIRNEEQTPERLKLLSTADQGNIFLEENRFEQAIDQFNLAEKYMKQLEAEKKQDKFGSHDSWVQNASGIHSARGFCRLQLKQYDLGIKDLTLAIKERPLYATNYKNRAMAYRLIGRKDLAALDERRFAELNAQ